MIDRDARCLPQFRALCELGFEVPSEVIQVFDHISYRTGKHVGTRCIFSESPSPTATAHTQICCPILALLGLPLTYEGALAEEISSHATRTQSDISDVSFPLPCHRLWSLSRLLTAVHWALEPI